MLEEASCTASKGEVIPACTYFTTRECHPHFTGGVLEGHEHYRVIGLENSGKFNIFPGPHAGGGGFEGASSLSFNISGAEAGSFRFPFV